MQSVIEVEVQDLHGYVHLIHPLPVSKYSTKQVQLGAGYLTIKSKPQVKQKVLVSQVMQGYSQGAQILLEFR